MPIRPNKVSIPTTLPSLLHLIDQTLSDFNLTYSEPVSPVRCYFHGEKVD